jgi:dTDP-4-dehydrorhamnose reductase
MATKQPELWGGLECTINRVHDRYMDQFTLGNVYAQPHTGAIASLGITKLRFPILWERHQPQMNTPIDWSWTEQQLQEYRDRGIDIIAGLVHHGSGPAFTNLLDESFPDLLADYAGLVARRFPHLQYYTPVNEPLTTARFSGLYGLWYPHGTSDRSFLQCLFNQLKGVVLSMQAIRAVNPAAKLVQTEDLGKVFSTPKLAYQAKFENERRWLTYDLLCGKVDQQHPLWAYLLRHGIPEEKILFFKENATPPDICGFNYYVTSERFLDDRVYRYPHLKPGGNGKHNYIDIEAARVPHKEPSGAAVLLREAWERFQTPIAITEAHLHCHREEQLRWFREIWKTASDLANEGVPVVGVTAWALLGSFGWNRLLTEKDCVYESGAFDLRGGAARPTALVRYLKSVGSNSTDEHLVDLPGWWRRETRYFNACVIAASEIRHREKKPILVIGKRGTLGQAFGRLCAERALPARLTSREDCDIADTSSIIRALEELKPWAVVNAAGYVRVDDAELDAEACYLANRTGPVQLAKACSERGLPLLCFSSDLVFDGEKESPYVETDITNPLNVYGRSKALCETEVSAAWPESLIVRTSAFFGPWVEKRLRDRKEVQVAKDILVSPTYVPDLVHTALDLLIDRERGIWHLANQGSFSWAELAGIIAEEGHYDRQLIQELSCEEMRYRARRPRNSVLGSERGSLLSNANDAFIRYFAAKTRSVEMMD